MGKRTILDMVNKAIEAHRDETYMMERAPEGYFGATFAETVAQARKIAGVLLSRGLARGDRVALLSEGRNTWIVGELGVLFGGGVCVPISTKITERDEILFRLRHSGSRFVILSERQKKKVLPLIPELPSLEGVIFLDADAQGTGKAVGVGWADALAAGEKWLGANPGALEAIENNIEESSPATLLYTSGTTAEPKGIVLSHLNYWVNVKEIREAFPLPVGSLTLLILPWDHSFAHTAGLYNFLSFGGRVAAVEMGPNIVATLRNIPKNLQETSPDFLVVVPSLAESFRRNIEKGAASGSPLAAKLFRATVSLGTRILGDGYRKRWDPLSILARVPYALLKAVVGKKVRHGLGGRLKFMASGGSGIAPDHVRFFSALGVPIYQGYGLSETSPVISSCSFRKGWQKIGSSGRPYPWADVRIVGSKGERLAAGEVGEITVKGECVMLGYFNNPEATAEAIRDGYFHTGDLGYLDKDGFLFITGRIKSLLVGQDGEKYSPEGLEQSITERVPFVQQAMLYNQQSPYTTALLTLDPDRIVSWAQAQGHDLGTDAGLDAVIRHVAAGLRAYREDPVLGAVFMVTWTPRTFAILPEPFTEENRMINSTLKMVRRTIVTTYEKTLAALYAQNSEPENAANRAALRKLVGSAGKP